MPAGIDHMCIMRPLPEDPAAFRTAAKFCFCLKNIFRNIVPDLSLVNGIQDSIAADAPGQYPARMRRIDPNDLFKLFHGIILLDQEMFPDPPPSDEACVPCQQYPLLLIRHAYKQRIVHRILIPYIISEDTHPAYQPPQHHVGSKRGI